MDGATEEEEHTERADASRYYICSSLREAIYCVFVYLVLYYSSQDQRTALHYASKGGHHDTVRVLLKRGADPNTCDKVSGV